MDRSILEEWIVTIARAQSLRLYYEVNTLVSREGKAALYEYPQDGHRICILHPGWLNKVYDICNQYGIILVRVNDQDAQVDVSDKIALLQSMVKTRSALARRGNAYFLTWNNQRVKYDLVYALHGERLIDTRGAYLYVLTPAGKQAVLEAQHG